MSLNEKKEKKQKNELPSEGKLTPDEFVNFFSSEQIRIPDFFRENQEFYLKILDKCLIQVDSQITAIREDVHIQEYKRAYHSSSYARVMTANMGLAELVRGFDKISNYLSGFYLSIQDSNIDEIEDRVSAYLSDIEEEVKRIRKGASMLR